MDESICKEKKVNKLKRSHRRRKKQKSSQKVKIDQSSKIKKIKSDENFSESLNQSCNSDSKFNKSKAEFEKLCKLFAQQWEVPSERRFSHYCFRCGQKFGNTDLYVFHGPECGTEYTRLKGSLSDSEDKKPETEDRISHNVSGILWMLTPSGKIFY